MSIRVTCLRRRVTGSVSTSFYLSPGLDCHMDWIITWIGLRVTCSSSDWVSVDELLPVTWIGLSPGLDWHVDWIARHVFAEWLGQCRRTSTVVWVHSSSERVKRSRICTQQRRHNQHISCRSVHHHHQQHHHHHHHHHHHNHQSIIIIIIMIYVKYRQSDICCFRAMILPLLTVTWWNWPVFTARCYA